MDIILKIADELHIKKGQVENAVKLLDEGNTVPFISRYRKEVTGSLNDEQLRDLSERLNYLRNLENKKAEVLKLLDEQGVLTEELTQKIYAAELLVEVEDIYRPYRPKRKTRASVAREKGLEPLALLMLELESGDREAILKEYVNEENGIESGNEALQGAMDILAELFTDDAEVRKYARRMTLEQGYILSDLIEGKEESTVYEMYFQYTGKISKEASHRILAMNRGEKEGVLNISLELPAKEIMEYIFKKNVPKRLLFLKEVKDSIYDGYKRLLAPSIEREIRSELTERAEEQAIKIFAFNLRKLLLQPPIKNKNVLGFDPAYRTGCKLACVDNFGKLLGTSVIYPTPPENKIEESKKVLKELLKKHHISAISLGNGTASRESEKFIADTLKEVGEDIAYTVTNEAGASVYSASKLAQNEFPELDVTLRSAISIARRIIDPLAELVKIEPKAIGVGQYQHDVNQKRLGETLGGVVEDSVNLVGIDLNTASPSLLSYISGVSKKMSESIVAYREENGPFKSRQELLEVKGLGPKAFEQAAGFLRIRESKNILDNTAVHPESYAIAEGLLKEMGIKIEDLQSKDLAIDFERLAETLHAGIPTLTDIVEELKKPGRDPREDLPKPVFKSGVMEIEDLKTGMELVGVVRNVVDFGAFIDIGVHQDGLVHISEMTDTYVKNPLDVVSVGDIVDVKVLSVDVKKKRIALTMKKEGVM